jgi:diketogulonate reductase-like aldo/keto reductase
MERRAIPGSGETIPVIGCGTWQAFDVPVEASRITPLVAVVQALVDGGGSLIDSSPMYGRAEAVVGAAMGQLGVRPKCFVATKVWTRGRAAGIAEMRRSMELLGVDQLDLMQIHNLLDWRTHLSTLRDWKAAGTIRYLGVTHYTASAHAELAEVLRREPVDFVQINYSIEEPEAATEILPLAADKGIAVIVNRPFGGGGTVRRLAGQQLPEWAGEYGCSTWSQLLLKWVLAQPAVTCVIPGTGRAAHMSEDCAAGDPPFPDAARLRALMA